MKKATIALAIFLPLISIAQSFVLTPYGLRNKLDTSKSFVVIDSLKLTTNQLYTKSLNFIKETSKNSESSIKLQIDNEYIGFMGYQSAISSATMSFLGKQTYNISVRYEANFKFRDGKIRFEIVSFRLPIMTDQYGNESYASLIEPKGSVGWKNFNVWDKNLVLNNEKIKTDIETFFNKKVLELKKYLTDADW